MIKFFTKRINNTKGFTLVELIVVVAILGILIALAVPRLIDVSRNSQRRAVEANLRTIDGAISMWEAGDNTGDPTKDNLAGAGGTLQKWPTGPADAEYDVKKVDTDGTITPDTGIWRAVVKGNVGGVNIGTEGEGVTLENLSWPTS